MPRIPVPNDVKRSSSDLASGMAEKPIDLTVRNWHAPFPGGGAVNATSGFTDPDQDYADRIPQLTLATGGTPGTYQLTGAWNGKERKATITTIAEQTAKADLPFDTITELTGPDPVAALTLEQGDSYADPPARAVAAGPNGGDHNVQLMLEPGVRVRTLPADRDWARRARRVSPASTTIPTLEAAFIWLRLERQFPLFKGSLLSIDVVP